MADINDILLDFKEDDVNGFCPSVPYYLVNEQYTSSFMITEVIRSKTILSLTLKSLYDLFYAHSQLKKLAMHRHVIEDKVSTELNIGNASFNVRIGSSKGYNGALQNCNKFLTKQSNPNDIHIKSRSKDKLTYTTILSDFYQQKFTGDESDVVSKSIEKPDSITIGLFARSAHRTEKKNLIRYHDQLIGAATFSVDNLNSLFLSWLATSDDTLADLQVHPDFASSDEKIQTKYGIGSFLVIISQVFYSIIKKKWCPIICQVHSLPQSGPLKFYLKNYFIKVRKEHQLVYEQLLHRKHHIIFDDQLLIWMVLFYPLFGLISKDIINKSDKLSFLKILARGYYYFLDNKIETKTTKSFLITDGINSITNNNESYLKNGIELNIDNEINDDIRNLKSWNDITTQQKPDFLFAGNSIINFFLESKDNNQHPMYLVDLGEGENGDEIGSCLFLCFSKILYGTSGYYYNLRLFFIIIILLLQN